jgi:hypothetical protein
MIHPLQQMVATIENLTLTITMICILDFMNNHLITTTCSYHSKEGYVNCSLQFMSLPLLQAISTSFCQVLANMTEAAVIVWNKKWIKLMGQLQFCTLIDLKINGFEQIEL